MNKFKYYFVLLLTGIAVVSCNKSDDDVVTVPVRDYAVQYKADNDSIEKYLKTNYIEEVTANFDVKISKIPAGGTQVSIWDQQDYPLQFRNVYNHDVTYKVYYLSLRKGTGLAPVNSDRVSVSYSGNTLDGNVFDTSYGIARTFNLSAYSTSPVIDGWGEIMPQFKTGTTQTGSDGVSTYDNYGAGVMFLPSGLAYYASSQTNIPAYSPLVFSFKLYQLQRVDSDNDGVFDYQEDINKDGYLYNIEDIVRYPTLPANLVDDTDADGKADYLDTDDDGDGFSTFYEITKPTGAAYSGISTFYPYDPIPDNPNTPNVDETETWGISRRPTGALTDPTKEESATNARKYVPEDYTEPTRLRIHVDKTYPYQKK